MAIGRKSITRDLRINVTDPQLPNIIRVQANKNFGICDIVAGQIVSQPYKDERGRKRTKNQFCPMTRMTELLSTFQGRQINDEVVMESICANVK